MKLDFNLEILFTEDIPNVSIFDEENGSGVPFQIFSVKNR